MRTEHHSVLRMALQVKILSLVLQDAEEVVHKHFLLCSFPLLSPPYAVSVQCHVHSGFETL